MIPTEWLDFFADQNESFRGALSHSVFLCFYGWFTFYFMVLVFSFILFSFWTPLSSGIIFLHLTFENGQFLYKKQVSINRKRGYARNESRVRKRKVFWTRPLHHPPILAAQSFKQLIAKQGKSGYRFEKFEIPWKFLSKKAGHGCKVKKMRRNKLIWWESFNYHPWLEEQYGRFTVKFPSNLFKFFCSQLVEKMCETGVLLSVLKWISKWKISPLQYR